MAQSAKQKAFNEKCQTEIGNKILTIMQQGKRPWVKPWDAVNQLLNPTTGKPYQGWNTFYLTLDALLDDLEHPLFCGVQQAKTKYGWFPRKGTHTSLIKKPHTQKVKGDNGEEKFIITGASWARVMALEFFNDDSSDIKIKDVVAEWQPQLTREHTPHEILDAFIAAQEVPVSHIGDRACYIPSRDIINMPVPEAFHSSSNYYAVLLHESTHATGHESRCARPDLMNWTGHGSPGYAFEELRAELGSAMLCEHFALPQDLENHASYLNSWISKLQDDPAYFWKAEKLAIAAMRFMQDKAAAKATALTPTPATVNP
jgi:antirestriction protein ArdC